MDFGRVFKEASDILFSGIWVTVYATLLSLIFAIVLGLIICLMGMSKVKALTWLSKAYIWFIRGTPLIVLGFLMYFGFPQFIQQVFKSNFRISVMVASVIVLTMNAGAYIAEIFRGGIQAVSYGQIEAARSLGLTKTKTMTKVVLPQAVRISIPSLVNQFIITLKDTSILAMIGMPEIVYHAKIYMGRSMNMFATWLVVALFYLVVISLLSWLSRYIEKRLDYGTKNFGS